MDRRDWIQRMATRRAKELSLEELLDYAEDAISEGWSERWVTDYMLAENTLHIGRECDTASIWQDGQLTMRWWGK